MSNPDNKFSNFFDNPKEAMDGMGIRPTPEQVVESLMVITSQDHNWYKSPAVRMIVLMTISKLAEDFKKQMEETGKMDLPVHMAGFLMLLGDFAIATLQYASDEEKEKFHSDRDDEDSY